jgi:isoquinoline 1-oxidoreductase beta subunit
MKHASIERPPSYGGRVKSWRRNGGVKVPGVEHVVETWRTAAVRFSFRWVSGRGRHKYLSSDVRAKLQVQWEAGPNDDYDTHGVSRCVGGNRERQPGKMARQNGDLDHTLQTASKRDQRRLLRAAPRTR